MSTRELRLAQVRRVASCVALSLLSAGANAYAQDASASSSPNSERISSIPIG